MRHHRPVAEFSLLEMTIASGMFVLVMAAVLQTLVASTKYSAFAEAQDELSSEGNRVMQSIAGDLATSGWWFSDRTLDYKNAVTDRDLRYMPYAMIQDAGGAGGASGQSTVLFHALRDTSDGRSFPEAPASIDEYLPGSPGDRTALFGTGGRQAWDSSFFARSQELLFLKSSVSTWNHVTDKMLTSQEDSPSIYFAGKRSEWTAVAASDTAEDLKRARLRILATSGWKPTLDGSGNVIGYSPRKVYSYVNAPAGTEITGADANTVPYGVVMESGWLIDPDGDLSGLQVNWVTLNGNAYTTSSQDKDNLKEYLFAVVRSSAGLGRLVRAHKVLEVSPGPSRFGVEVGNLLPRASGASGSYYMEVDKVLSDNVMRAVFDTFRTVDEGASTVTSLDYNTVRVRLYLARRVLASTDGAVLTRIIDRVFTMRAQNSEPDKDPLATDSNASVLGTSAIGLPF